MTVTHTTETQTLVLGNWKMHGNQASNAALLDALLTGACAYNSASALPPDVQLGVCVPYPYLAQAQTRLAGTGLYWGAQDISADPAGAHTGDVCADMLKDFDVRWVLVGHSERRLNHAENSLLVARKAQAALMAGLSPVVCVGETWDQRASDQTEEVISGQLRPILDLAQTLEPAALAKITLAYEPVWAIGTGQSATPEQAQAVHAAIRAQLATVGAENCLILYGGSVKASNAAALLGMPDIDGALVGSASLDAREFLRIAAMAASTRQTP